MKTDTKLKNCPCGETPKELCIEAGARNSYAFAAGDCCQSWLVEFKTNYYELDSKECLQLANKAWNKQKRQALNQKQASANKSAPADNDNISNPARQAADKCPRCKSNNLYYTDEGWQLGKRNRYQRYYCYMCQDCNFSGTEWYGLKFICHTDNKKGRK